MTPRVLALASACALLAHSAVAHAGIGNATIEIEVHLADDDGDFVQSNEIERIDFFNFARCQCAVEQPGTSGTSDTAGPGTFQAELTLVTNGETINSGEEVELTVGTNCDNDDLTVRNCESITTVLDARSELNDAPNYNIEANQFMFPNAGGCSENTGTANIYALLDDENDGLIDQSFLASYNYDTLAPPLPDNIVASEGENAITVSWDELESRQGEIEYYQVLCARADGSPAFTNAPDEARYDTPFSVCDSATRIPITSGGSSGDGPDAGPGDSPDAGPDDSPDAGSGGTELPDWLDTLDPAYVCATGGQSARSIRVGGLENGESYRIALVTTDDARNIAAIDLGEITPEPVRDFWEDYHDQGGAADGGLCLVTSTFGDDHWTTRALRRFRDNTLASSSAGRWLIEVYYAYVAPLGAAAEASFAARLAAAAVIVPLAGVAAAWESTSPASKLLILCAVLGLVLLRRQSRNRRGGRATSARAAATCWPRKRGALALSAVLGGLLVILGHAGTAQAQPDPYWEVWEPVEEQAEPESLLPQWNVGIRLGPYTPDIDGEFSAEPGPYELMFGGAGLMGAAELERFFTYPMGQLGVSVGVGITGKTANAFEICSDGDTTCTPGEVVMENGAPKRSAGDTTAFRLLPVTVGAVYRFTAIDDKWRVPLVPYARLGLAYYLWWITAPDGSLAEAPTDDCPNLDGCDGDRALGASLGWQATIGLALRAERFDAQAARSLRNELGIAHAGIYAELVYADVDGFGADGKLSVGDLTWFGGLNFEF